MSWGRCGRTGSWITVGAAAQPARLASANTQLHDVRLFIGWGASSGLRHRPDAGLVIERRLLNQHIVPGAGIVDLCGGQLQLRLTELDDRAESGATGAD